MIEDGRYPYGAYRRVGQMRDVVDILTSPDWVVCDTEGVECPLASVRLFPDTPLNSRTK